MYFYKAVYNLYICNYIVKNMILYLYIENLGDKLYEKRKERKI